MDSSMGKAAADFIGGIEKGCARIAIIGVSIVVILLAVIGFLLFKYVF